MIGMPRMAGKWIHAVFGLIACLVGALVAASPVIWSRINTSASLLGPCRSENDLQALVRGRYIAHLRGELKGEKLPDDFDSRIATTMAGNASIELNDGSMSLENGRTLLQDAAGRSETARRYLCDFYADANRGAKSADSVDSFVQREVSSLTEATVTAAKSDAATLRSPGLSRPPDNRSATEPTAIPEQAKATQPTGPATDVAATGAGSGGIVYVKTNANLRTGPGTEQAAVGSAAPGTQLHVLSTDQGWLNVRTNEGLQGWIRADLTAPQP